MGMLQENKSRKKISNDPNNTKWTRDTTTFGQKILRSQGWQPGQFLGAQDAPHAALHSAASASYIRVVLKDDMKGLGFDRAKEDEVTGLDVFSDVLSRLNGKSESAVQEDRDARLAIKTNRYVEMRWGPMRFVRGGLLVGDKLEEEVAVEVVEGAGDGGGGAEVTRSKRDRKSRKRKAEEEAEGREDSEAAGKKEKEKKRRRKDGSEDGEEDKKEDKKKKKKRREEDKDKTKKKKKQSKKSSKSKDASDDSEDDNDEKSEERAAKKKAKREKKKERREKEEEKKRRKAVKAADDGATASSSSSDSDSDSDSDADASGRGRSATATPAATSGTSTPLGNRNFVRSRYIAQKRQAVMDAAALKQIFMVKA